MSTKAKIETDGLIGSAGGVRSEPGGRAQRPAGGASLEIPDAVRDRLSDEVTDELLAGALPQVEPSRCRYLAALLISQRTDGLAPEVILSPGPSTPTSTPTSSTTS